MWGAIIGDVIGSVYEWDRIKTKTFDLFHSEGHFTDDSVCTAAIADILLHDRRAPETLQKWCRRYPASYGSWFVDWMWSDHPEPYGSFGNGAAMRISPAAFLHYDDLQSALATSDRLTGITHNHPEGIKGARATVHATWLALEGEEAHVIRRTISARYRYNLVRSVDDIRTFYRFDETCQNTVPEAITCALESTCFEDAIRNAISLGGDSDTLAAIAGPIAEGLHGIPEGIQRVVEERFLAKAPDIVEVMREMYDEVEKRRARQRARRRKTATRPRPRFPARPG